MLLVTTADERTWKTNEKILFLGEWCKRYTRRHVWSTLQHETLPYHWDDRTKLYRDFLYLREVYERYLAALTQSLNTLHGCNHSTRYWRILIGPWLRYFIEILYDRFLSIEKAVEGRNVNLTWIMESDPWAWVPADFWAFQRFFISDQWNHFIYKEIIKEFRQIKYQVIQEPNTPLNLRVDDFDAIFNSTESKKTSCSKRIAAALTDWYSHNIPSKFNRIVFISTYWSSLDKAAIQLALGQLPYLESEAIKYPNPVIQPKKREYLKLSLATDLFEIILEKLICKQIPAAYTEGYEEFQNKALSHFPKRVKAIFTANAYNSDDGFKIWAAGQVEKKMKLLIAQHGGNYGTALWSQTEEHQIAISDRFYSWGWEKKDDKRIKRMPALKLFRLKTEIKPDPTGKILWIQMAIPRYSYWMYSIPVSSQFLNYFNEQVSFAKKLSSPARELLRLRLYHLSYGWDIIERFTDNGLGEYIDTANPTFISALNTSRLSISTYNATTYLETFAANYPTLLFWNPEHWELRQTAQPYFEGLIKAGILHYTPESAATKVNEIYADPISWWNQPEVQAAKDKFCNEFAFTSDNWLREWKTELSSL